MRIQPQIQSSPIQSENKEEIFPSSPTFENMEKSLPTSENKKIPSAPLPAFVLHFTPLFDRVLLTVIGDGTGDGPYNVQLLLEHQVDKFVSELRSRMSADETDDIRLVTRIYYRECNGIVNYTEVESKGTSISLENAAYWYRSIVMPDVESFVLTTIGSGGEVLYVCHQKVYLTNNKSVVEQNPTRQIVYIGNVVYEMDEDGVLIFKDTVEPGFRNM